MKDGSDTSAIVNKFGRLYSEELGISVDSGKESELFKWFLASVLFGRRISEGIAINTYRGFEKEKVLTPQAILDTGWRKLVIILDTGGYVRYDFSVADNLINISKKLLSDYGTLTELHKRALDSKDLEQRLLAFKGVGPVTVSIFLREMRHVWTKADPEISPYAELAAEKLKINLKTLDRHTKQFVRLERALLRIGKNYIRKNKPIPVAS